MANKTPVTVLQEFMVKNESIPHYDFLEPDNTGVFQCKAAALDIFVTGKGRCKKDAKQDAARLVLKKLTETGKYFPRECDNLSPPRHAAAPETEITMNNVGILKDLCSEFHMPTPEYVVLLETGLPHSKQFTIQCKIASLERTATATTKKQAKQLAAGMLVKYFNEHMSSRMAEFVDSTEPSNLSKANDMAKDKFFDQTDVPWRPNLGQIIGNYHFGLKEIIEDAKISEALNYLESYDHSEETVCVIEKLLKILNLEFEWEELESNDDKKVVTLLKIPHANPPAYLAAEGENKIAGKTHTAVEALEYFSLMLTM